MNQGFFHALLRHPDAIAVLLIAIVLLSWPGVIQPTNPATFTRYEASNLVGEQYVSNLETATGICAGPRIGHVVTGVGRPDRRTTGSAQLRGGASQYRRPGGHLEVGRFGCSERG